MNRNQIILTGAVVVIVLIMLYTFSGSQEDYERKILAQREEKERFMRTSPESPFAGDSTFHALSFFPPDKTFRVNAKIIPIENRKTVVLPTSDGSSRRYLEYAHAEFTLDGKTHRLIILEIMDMGPTRGTLFLAFGDDTSARETYGGGRYLDVKKPKGQTSIVLDFNEAYNPYCAYNERYVCPLPPPENLLSIAIRAGEKTYAK